MFGAARLEKRLQRIERKLDLLLDAYGIEGASLPGISDAAAREIRDYIDRNEKIKAIKAYREAAGVGLKEAKEYIDSL